MSQGPGSRVALPLVGCVTRGSHSTLLRARPCQLQEESGSGILGEFADSQSTSIAMMFLPCASTTLGFGDIAVKETHWPRCQCRTWVCSALSPKAWPPCLRDWLGSEPSFPVSTWLRVCRG